MRKGAKGQKVAPAPRSFFTQATSNPNSGRVVSQHQSTRAGSQTQSSHANPSSRPVSQHHSGHAAAAPRLMGPVHVGSSDGVGSAHVASQGHAGPGSLAHTGSAHVGSSDRVGSAHVASQGHAGSGSLAHTGSAHVGLECNAMSDGVAINESRAAEMAADSPVDAVACVTLNFLVVDDVTSNRKVSNCVLYFFYLLSRMPSKHRLRCLIAWYYCMLNI